MIMPALSHRLPAGVAYLALCLTLACATAARAPVPFPPTIRDWRGQPPLGYPAAADRRNLPAGGSVRFRGLQLTVVSPVPDTAQPGVVVGLELSEGGASERRTVAEGSGFNWRGFHIAVVGIGTPGELGAGLVSLEVGELAGLPPQVAHSDSAGGAALRLRIPHEVTHITLHHTGDAQPLKPEDDPAAKLRALQSWGARDRNWWDVPYHLLLDLDGRIYEGRDWHYMGETNTTYDPRGHLLISVIGNYGVQEPTAAQVASIADIMAWAVARFNVPLDRIGGHFQYASTSCPGRYLRQYLEDGTLRRMVEERLAQTR